jgi:hypothetical protein
MKSSANKYSEKHGQNHNQKPNQQPSHKRSDQLKSFLEEKDPLLSMKEDLLDAESDIPAHLDIARTVCFGGDAADQEFNNEAIASSSLTQSIELFHDLIEKEVIKAANAMEVDELELKAWVDLQLEVPAKTILTLLRMIQNLHLDPLNEEIGFTQHEDGSWQVFTTIEGCSRLLNQHPQFNGLVFTQADTLIEGVPEWMECSIYRRDRILPITVREHYLEVKGENAIWQKMPRRMLRHRALQQCVRLAI